ncbi:MAG: hypothetical protein H0T51_19090, partial [Pirellulales bacterium]|nr:hypothetical protein [Pirellulales bacterium]
AAIALSKAGTEIRIGFGENAIEIPLRLPFSWKLFYFGSVAFAVGNFLYRTFCPPLIRDYSTFTEFEHEGKGPDFILDQFLETSFNLVEHGSTAKKDYGKCIVREFLTHFTDKVVSDQKTTTESSPDDDGFEQYMNRLLPNYDAKRDGKITIAKPKVAASFWYARDAANESGGGLRALCSWSYIFGYCAFLWVALQGFMYVVRV